MASGAGLDPKRLASLVAVLEGRPEILEAYLFGSQARGQAGPLSDIDVAVRTDGCAVPRGPFGYAAELATDLMAALRTNAIDVVLLDDAPPLLYHRVLRDGVRLLSRDLAATTTREGQALSRYCDFACQLAKIDRELGERIRSGGFGR